MRQYGLDNLKRILKRSRQAKCSFCYSDDIGCDIHHIKGRKIPDHHNLENLSYLCPNCHRAVHEGRIPEDALKNLEEHMAGDWKILYRW